METLDLALIGPRGVGKTTYLERWISGQFVRSYRPTKGLLVRILNIHTNRGNIRLRVWEHRRAHSLISRIDGVIIMADRTEAAFMTTLEQYYCEVKRKTQAPVVLCGTKIDLVDHPILESYYGISSRLGYNFERVLLDLIRTRLQDPSIDLAETPIQRPWLQDLTRMATIV